MKGRNTTIYLSSKYLYIIKESIKSIEAEQYKLKDINSVLRFGLRLIRRYFSIKDPLSPKELKSLKEWV